MTDADLVVVRATIIIFLFAWIMPRLLVALARTGK